MTGKPEGHTSSVNHTDERNDQQSYWVDEWGTICTGLANHQYDYVGHVRIYHEGSLRSSNAKRFNFGEVP